MRGIFLFRRCVLRSPNCHSKDTTGLMKECGPNNNNRTRCSLLNIRDIRDKYTLTLRNKFDALQEISETPNPNDEYENFVNAHLEAATECIPTKQRAKPSPTRDINGKKKRTDVKTASKCNRRNLTNINALKLKKTQNELTNVYLKEQTEYIQNQINKIRDSVEDNQSMIAWQTVNEVSRRKCTEGAN